MMKLSAIAACVLLSFGANMARADDAPRKINFAKVLVGADGPFKECRKLDEASGKCIDQVELTLGRLCLSAAAMPDKSASPADQVAHGHLAMRLLDIISRQGAQEEALSADDIKFLKDQIAKLGYNTMAVYQASRLLDPTVDK